MKRVFLFFVLLAGLAQSAAAEISRRVIDIPTRPGVTQRFLHLAPSEPKASVILFAGGHGALNIADSGRFGWGALNFLVRTRETFAAHGLAVAVIDKPSDMPSLDRRRQTREHAEDVRAVMNWLRKEHGLPVWLIGSSRGTQSAAYVAAALGGGPDSPDGLVLTSTILNDPHGRPVPEMPLERLRMPVLVVHHESDGCGLCPYGDLARLMDRLTNVPRRELVTVTGGVDQGDPCGPLGHHGFNGVEDAVVAGIAAWILGK